MSKVDPPEGIDRRHIDEAGGTRFHNWPTGLIGLGLLIMASMLGMFGSEASLAAEGDAAMLRVHAPSRIRNGEFYEMTITVESRETIDNLVLQVDEGVWHDVTVNTFFPAAEAETFADGAFEFEFGPIEAGTTFTVKVDCQVNPDHAPAANVGTIGIADDTETLAELEYRLEVLP